MKLAGAATSRPQTSLKLPVGHQISIKPPRQSGGSSNSDSNSNSNININSESNMGKFNWRANWEILLVFVIIIVGIVITTIAAIRSRDKHLLVTPLGESAGGFGFGGGGGGGIVEFTSAGQVPALPQTDFQLSDGAEESGTDGDEQSHLGLASLLVSTTRAPPSTATTRNQRGDRKRSHPTNRLQDGPAHSAAAQNQRRPMTPPAPVSDLDRPQQSGSQQRGFEMTMSTEQTPVQQQFPRQLNSASQDEQHRHEPRYRQRGAMEQSADRANEQSDYENQRAQLETGSNEHVKAGQQLQIQMQMQGPYELAAALQNNQQFHATKAKVAHKIEQPPASSSSPTPPPDSTEELMTSYTRVPVNPAANHSETTAGFDSLQLNKKASNGSSDSETSSLAGELMNRPPPPPLSVQDYSQRPALYQHRHLPSSLPLEMLLSELMKLTPQPQPTPTPQPLMDSTVSLDQPVNSRPHLGILQQLRSLPGPLMALFQQTANQPNSARPSNTGEFYPNQQRGASDIYANYMHMQTPNNDVSESAQHYQRLAMSPYNELESLVARSLRTTNPLPAYPPPKGVPQTWVPPNMGGVSILQEDVSSSNADFVASETAGFVRGATGGAQETGTLQAAASEQVNQQQKEQQQQQQQQPSVAPTSDGGASQNNQSQQSQVNNLLNGISIKSMPISSGAQQQQVSATQRVPLAHKQVASEVANLEAGRMETLPSVTNQPPKSSLNLADLQQYFNQPSRRSDGGQPMRTISPLGTAQIGPQLSKLPSSQAILLNSIGGRMRRSTRENEEDEDDEPEEYSDSTPVSIVTPDGRPLSDDVQHGRAQRLAPGSSKLELASSQRETNHADLSDESPLNHYYETHQKTSPEHDSERDQRANGGKQKSAKRSRKKTKQLQKLEAADSRLMSKLLGVASTNDELEDELDGDDEDSVGERRKEELEDAEFGITNDERSNGPSMNSDDLNGTNQADNHEVTRLSKASSSDGEQPPMGSAGSTDSGAYARRQNQQRSDVEFYGHPGEETRQLKYGILGSGNYEVVNGGIYPDHDESTAAVNSVANYVRRPSDGGGGGLLLAGLPKLIGSMAAAAAASDDGRLAGRPRIGAPGFMWGASVTGPASSNEMGRLYNRIETPESGNTLTRNPLLDMLSHNQNLASNDHTSTFFPPTLVAAHQLGSSGSSSRSTHLSRETEPSNAQANDSDAASNGKLKFKRKKPMKQAQDQDDQGYSSDDDRLVPSNFAKRGKQDQMTTMETLNDANNHIRSASDREEDQETSGKTNPFRSYHISPSKKVTIFSDQDLDSAPSDVVGWIVRATNPTKDEPIRQFHRTR